MKKWYYEKANGELIDISKLGISFKGRLPSNDWVDKEVNILRLNAEYHKKHTNFLVRAWQKRFSPEKYEKLYDYEDYVEVKVSFEQYDEIFYELINNEEDLEYGCNIGLCDNRTRVEKLVIKYPKTNE